ncbi:MAG: hypothetical protein LBK95_18720 [Bifidobacteriaceae bacterium]|jgi:hypothetical protein|nr:hypothetical protein [Bifidobacteriaceae bacterium]
MFGVVVAVGLAVGCESKDQEEPPPASGSPTDEAVVVARQADAAQALAECLGEYGIETDTTGRVAVDGYNADFVLVWPKLTADSHVLITPDGSEEITGDHDADEIDRSKPTLIDGDRDLSEEYTECIESSGYFIPSSETDSTEK